MDLAIDLRLQPRFEVHGQSAWIDWRDGDCGGGAYAELINLSLGGTLILAPVLPRVGRAVSFQLDGLPAWTRVAAVVVAAHPGRRVHRVQLAFRWACPVAILVAAIGEDAMLVAMLGDPEPA